MVYAEEIRKTILKLARERGPGNAFCPSDVAQMLDRENWQMILDHVRLVVSSLIKEGKIVATSGKLADKFRISNPVLFKKHKK